MQITNSLDKKTFWSAAKKKVLTAIVILAFAFSDICFASGLAQQTLAPPLASSPIAEVSKNEHGDPGTIASTQERAARNDEIRRHWAMHEVGLLLSRSLELGLSSPAVIDIVNEFLSISSRDADVATEEYVVEGIEEVRSGAGTLVGYQIPVEQNGELAYYLSFSLREEQGSVSFSSIKIAGAEKQVFLTLDPHRQKSYSDGEHAHEKSTDSASHVAAGFSVGPSTEDLLRQLFSHGIFKENRISLSELQRIMDADIPWIAFERDLRVLQVLSIIEERAGKYYLSDWVRVPGEEELLRILRQVSLIEVSSSEERLAVARSLIEPIRSGYFERRILDIIASPIEDEGLYLERLSDVLSSALQGRQAEDMAALCKKILAGEAKIQVPKEAAILIRSFLAVYYFEVPDGQEKVSVSYIIPMFKEQARIKTPQEHEHGEDIVRKKILQTANLFSVNPALEGTLIFVDDGERNPERPKESSGEMALEIIKNEFAHLFEEGAVKVLFLDRETKALLGGRKGSGVMYGLRQGLNDGADYLFYVDADSSSPIDESGVFLGALNDGSSVAAIASRRMDGSVVVNRSGKEKLTSAVYNMLVRIILGLRFTDTQTGFKAFSREALQKVIPVDENWQFDTDFIYDFSFDTDLLLRLVNAYGDMREDAVVEIPTVWIGSREESNIRLKDPFVMAGGLFRQRYRALKRKRFSSLGEQKKKIVKPAGTGHEGERAAKKTRDDKTKVAEEERKKELARLLNKAEENAVRLFDQLKWSQSRIETRVDFIALTRDWIDSLTGSHPQAQDLNVLISAVRRRCESAGIKFIEGPADAVKQSVREIKKDNNKARGIVVTGKDALAYFDDIFSVLPESKSLNTIVAGVDTRNLTEGAYLALVEVLEASVVILRQSYYEGFDETVKERLLKIYEEIGLSFRDDRVLVFKLPEAQAVDYVEKLRRIYRIQISA